MTRTEKLIIAWESEEVEIKPRLLLKKEHRKWHNGVLEIRYVESTEEKVLGGTFLNVSYFPVTQMAPDSASPESCVI